MEGLDLKTHSIYEIPGKSLIINDTIYEILPLIDETDQFYEFPLKNIVSKTINFVCKIFKVKKGSKEYNDIRNFEPVKNFYWEVLSKKPELVDPVFKNATFEYNEIYETANGLVKLQRSTHKIDNPEHYEDLMLKGAKEINENDLASAACTYYDILKQNPYHEHALINLARIANQTESGNGFVIAQSAVKVDANITEANTQMVLACIKMQNYSLAKKFLQRSAERWKYNFDTVDRAIKLAIQTNDFELFYRQIWFLERSGIPKAIIDNYRSENETLRTLSQAQAEKMRAKRKKAIETTMQLQTKIKWNEAWEFIEKVNAELDDSILSLNALICQYHLLKESQSETTSTEHSFFKKKENKIKVSKQKLEELGHKAYKLATDMPKGPQDACYSLAILTLVWASEYEYPKQILQILNKQYESPFDLPGVPIFVHDYSIEEKDVTSILHSIDKVLANAELNEDEKVQVTVLKAKYQEYQNALNPE